MVFRKISLALVMLLVACGDISGTDPNVRIAVPPSYSTYLPSLASKPYSQAVTTVLRDQKLPAVADYAGTGDWRVRLRANRANGMVSPVFGLVDPAGNEQISVETGAVPADIWQQAQPDIMARAAAEAAPKLAAAFQRVVAERRQSVQQRLDADARRKSEADALTAQQRATDEARRKQLADAVTEQKRLAEELRLRQAEDAQLRATEDARRKQEIEAMATQLRAADDARQLREAAELAARQRALEDTRRLQDAEAQAARRSSTAGVGEAPAQRWRGTRLRVLR